MLFLLCMFRSFQICIGLPKYMDPNPASVSVTSMQHVLVPNSTHHQFKQLTLTKINGCVFHSV